MKNIFSQKNVECFNLAPMEAASFGLGVRRRSVAEPTERQDERYSGQRVGKVKSMTTCHAPNFIENFKPLLFDKFKVFVAVVGFYV
ncbi:hypothetical protein G6R40_12275 [Chryseobacterium sp. POL2]|uniref:hypothetical protein n=1 Tax=Chryseobacterium sp. POL2 TaxID=2713414 RepID=UPI0013E199D0|nr:hypothetical protein [Chryseobacterium sp. POL2]QIG90381.1 hypothetical protein G6R40_12275 [Chryseobacterium sp. POL2]